MAINIVWTKRAVLKFDKIIEYLQIRWGEKVTKLFVKRTFNLINIIAEHKNIGTIELEHQNIRAIIVTKHNTMFYRYDKNKLIILNFFDNRKKTKRSKK